MNRAVSKMVEEALKYNQVESVLESGEEEDIFSPEYFETLSDVKMPATKLELLVKMLRKQIKEYGKVNQLAAKSFQELLENTIAEYHERRKHLTIDGVVVNEKCKNLAKKVKEIIDTKSSFADWLNNQNVRNQLKLDIKICLVKNGYPPRYCPEVFNKIMQQVENFEEYSGAED